MSGMPVALLLPVMVAGAVAMALALWLWARLRRAPQAARRRRAQRSRPASATGWLDTLPDIAAARPAVAQAGRRAFHGRRAKRSMRPDLSRAYQAPQGAAEADAWHRQRQARHGH